MKYWCNGIEFFKCRSSLTFRAVNRPYSYSHGWTGTSMRWRLMQGKKFAFEMSSPRQPLFHARFQYNRENTNMAYYL